MRQFLLTLSTAAAAAAVTAAIILFAVRPDAAPPPAPAVMPEVRAPNHPPAAAPADGAGALQNAFSAAIERAMPAVVLVTARRRVGVVSFDYYGDPRKLDYLDVPSGQGSGFFIRRDGYILTNFHVVRDQDSFWITMHDGEELPARVVGADPPSDLALLKVDAAADRVFPALEFADPERVRVGQWAIAIGAPFSLNRTVTVGIVSNKQRSGVGMNLHENYIQTDASVNPGNSGGPLLDLDGRVLGVNDFILSPSGGNIGLSFAISSAIAADVTRQMLRDGYVRRPWLGVVFGELPRETAADHQSGGVRLLQIYRDSPAAGRLQPGDVVVAVGGAPVRTAADFQKAVFAAATGQPLELEIRRDGAIRRVSVTPEEAPRDYYRKFRDGGATRAGFHD